MIYRNKRDQEAWLREKTLSSLKENVYLQEHDIVQVAENKHFYEVVTEVTEIPLQNHLYAKSISSDTASSASTADKLSTARNIAISGAVTGNADFDGTKNISISTTLNNIDANKITSGTISVDRLPKSAFDEFLAVENKTARLALTKDRVQNGDTVKETDTGRMYLVINDTKLNIEEGYQEYTTIVDWASITGKPSDFHPETHTHTKEQITNFPQSLKNPYALSISVNGTRKGSYDGSSITNINVAAADLNVYNKGEVDAKLSEKAPSQHQHPTWYYTKNEIDSKLSSKANTSHAHNTLKIINGSKSITYDGTSAKEITIEAGSNVPSAHTHSSENIVNLNGYTKHNYGGSLNTTDTLNLALGKLEKNIELKANLNHSHSQYATTDMITNKADLNHSHSSNNIAYMTGYSKASSYSQINAYDSLNVAIGKLEKGLEEKANADMLASKADTNHSHGSNNITYMTGYSKDYSGGAISPSDSLNKAVGKLEKNLDNKADVSHSHSGYAHSNHAHSSDSITALSGYRKEHYYGALSSSDNLNQALSKIENNIDDKASLNHNHSEYATQNYVTTWLAEYVPKNGSSTISGSLTVTGEILSNNNVTAYSDRTLKENLIELDDSVIEKLKQLKFYNYNMISDETKRKRVGVIAQELEELFPELVFEDENGIKSVDYIGLNTYFSFVIQQKLFGL